MRIFTILLSLLLVVWATLWANVAGAEPGQDVSIKQVDISNKKVIPINEKGVSIWGGTGTAFVVRPDGYLVSNVHVVRPTSKDPKTGRVIMRTYDAKITVVLASKSYPARVVHMDTERDLALLKIDAENLPFLPLANSEGAGLGDEVTTFGFPLTGRLGKGLKMTRGIVSGIETSAEHERLLEGGGSGHRLILTDASVNRGNSGGPLMNARGEVIGVNTQVYVTEVGGDVTRATAINHARELMHGQALEAPPSQRRSRLEPSELAKQAGPAVAYVEVRPTVWSIKAHDKYASNLSFSADGSILVSASESDESVRLWHVGSGQLVGEILGDSGPLCFSKQGDLLAVTRYDEVSLLEFGDGTISERWRIELPAFVRAVAISPDGTLLAVGCHDKMIYVIEVNYPAKAVALRGHSETVDELTFSPNGEFLASADDPVGDAEVRIWDVASREFKYAVSVPHAKPMAFSSDGSYLLANNHVIDIKTRQVVRRFEAYFHDRTRFLRDDSFLIGDMDKALHLFDLSTGVDLGAFAMPNVNSDARIGIGSFAASPDERWVACGGYDGEVYWFDIESLMDRVSRILPRDLPGDSYPKHLTWSPDGRFIAAYAETNEDNGQITLWNTDSGKIEHRIQISSVLDLAFSADSGLLAACGYNLAGGEDEDGFVRFYDVKTGKSTWTHRQPHSMAAIAFDPAGRMLATFHYNDTVTLRDVKTREVTGEFSFNANHLLFSPDGRLLVATSHEGKVVAWDVKQRKILWKLDAHNHLFKAMAFSPSGEQIATVGWDKDGDVIHDRLKLWNANSGSMTSVIEDFDSDILEFSPDGTLLFNRHYRVMERNLVTNEQRHVFALVDHLSEYAFSHNRQYLAYLTHDGTLRVQFLGE